MRKFLQPLNSILNMQRSRRFLLPILLSLACFLALSACSAKEAPYLPDSDVRVGVVPFSQPASTTDLMAGYISENNAAVEARTFPMLDNDFADLLAEMTTRSYVGLDKARQCMAQNPKNPNGPAFEYWLGIGRCMEVEALIVPQVYSWQERVGGELGADTPASVAVDFFLLDVSNGTLLARSRYDEKQRPLLENLLDINKFIERKGRWVSAATLAKEGMFKSIKEFGL